MRQRRSSWARVAAKIQGGQAGSAQTRKASRAPGFRAARATRACRAEIPRSRGSWGESWRSALSSCGAADSPAAQGSQAEPGVDAKLNQAQ